MIAAFDPRRRAVLALAALACAPALAQETMLVAPAGPSVAVTGAATAKVQNDRMQAVLRVEAENASAQAAASEVNAKMGKALAHAKAVPGVEAKSAGYSTWQSWEKGRPSKWKVVQSLSVAGADFAALAALVTRLQDEDGMLVTSMGFFLAPETRRRAEDALTREAIRAWQQRAATAAETLGFASWRPGRVNVVTGDAGFAPRQEFAMRAATQVAGSPPVAVEGGTTELTVTVTGDAMLDKVGPR